MKQRGIRYSGLARALSKLGIMSRAEARKLIRSGRVSVGGSVETDPDRRVAISAGDISIDGKRVETPALRTFLFYKPRGVVTTRHDEKGRRNVFSYVESTGLFLHAAGRLDFATSGLLLLTNDSRLSAYLTAPSNNIVRRYLVTVRGKMSERAIGLMTEGIIEAGEALRAGAAELRKSSNKESHLTIDLTEGKNREIRRLCRAVGHEVTRLKRVAFGPFELGTMQPGEFREISPEELRKAFPHLYRAEDYSGPR